MTLSPFQIFEAILFAYAVHYAGAVVRGLKKDRAEWSGPGAAEDWTIRASLVIHWGLGALAGAYAIWFVTWIVRSIAGAL